MIAGENGFRKWTDLIRIAVEQQATVKGQPSALDGGDRTLHIRCGTDIMYDLALVGFSGDILSFADPYVEGPVPQTQSLEEFVRIRAAISSKIYPDNFAGPHGFPVWVRYCHFFNFLFVMMLIRSGLSILMDHPRLYFNDGCTPGSE